jgi:hypothetical protein
MKKQISIIIAAVATAALFSCTKEKVETQTNIEPGEEVSIASKSSLVPIFINPLNVGLLGRYEFNSTLKDTTGKLSDAVSTVNRVLYTTDRKGVANSAIRFNAAYGLDLINVPLDTNMSISAWVKKEDIVSDYMRLIVEGTHCLSFSQDLDKYQAGAWNGTTGQYVVSGPMDNNWHLLVASRDKTSLKYYIDGILIGTSPTPAGYTPPSTTSEYAIGYGYNNGYKYWKGSLDDFRIYKRVLTTSDINKLKNL